MASKIVLPALLLVGRVACSLEHAQQETSPSQATSELDDSTASFITLSVGESLATSAGTLFYTTTFSSLFTSTEMPSSSRLITTASQQTESPNASFITLSIGESFFTSTGTVVYTNTFSSLVTATESPSITSSPRTSASEMSTGINSTTSTEQSITTTSSQGSGLSTWRSSSVTTSSGTTTSSQNSSTIISTQGYATTSSLERTPGGKSSTSTMSKSLNSTSSTTIASNKPISISKWSSKSSTNSPTSSSPARLPTNYLNSASSTSSAHSNSSATSIISSSSTSLSSTRSVTSTPNKNSTISSSSTGAIIPTSSSSSSNSSSWTNSATSKTSTPALSSLFNSTMIASATSSSLTGSTVISSSTLSSSTSSNRSSSNSTTALSTTNSSISGTKFSPTSSTTASLSRSPSLTGSSTSGANSSSTSSHNLVSTKSSSSSSLSSTSGANSTTSISTTSSSTSSSSSPTPTGADGCPIVKGDQNCTTVNTPDPQCFNLLDLPDFIIHWWEANNATCAKKQLGFGDCWYNMMTPYWPANCSEVIINGNCQSPKWIDFCGKFNGIQNFYVTYSIWNTWTYGTNLYQGMYNAAEYVSSQVGEITTAFNPPDPSVPMWAKDLLLALSFGLSLYAEGSVVEKAVLRSQPQTTTLLDHLLPNGDSSTTISTWAEVESQVEMWVQQWANVTAEYWLPELQANITDFIGWCQNAPCTGSPISLPGIQNPLSQGLTTWIIGTILNDLSWVVTRGAGIDIHQMQNVNGSNLAWNTNCGGGYDSLGVCDTYFFDGTDTYSIVNPNDMFNNTGPYLEWLFGGDNPFTTGNLLFTQGLACTATCGSNGGCSPSLGGSDPTQLNCVSPVRVCTWTWDTYGPWEPGCTDANAATGKSLLPGFCSPDCKGEADNIYACQVPRGYLGGGILLDGPGTWAYRSTCNSWG